MPIKNKNKIPKKELEEVCKRIVFLNNTITYIGEELKEIENKLRALSNCQKNLSN